MNPMVGLFLFCVFADYCTSVTPRHNPHSLLIQRIIRSPKTGRSLHDGAGLVRIDSLHVDSRLRYRYAHTLVSSRFTNQANSSQQIKFSVLLPETAFITGFSLEVGGKLYKSFLKEKQKAKHQYQDAVDSGLTAGHLAVSARDSNHFYVSLSVEAHGRASFNLSYEQLLSRKLGKYNHVINLHPGQIVPDLSVTVQLWEPQALTKLSVLPFSSGGHAKLNTNINTDSYVWAGVIVERPTPNQATVLFHPSAERQQQLSVDKGEGLAGQLTVSYDVDNQQPGGTILVNEGYFVHVVAPSGLAPLRKHAILTLDVSGSMAGHKLRQLKDALATILDDLHPEDYFNIIEFSYAVTVWNLDSLSSSTVIQPELQTSGLMWFNKAEISSTAAPTTASPPSSLTNTVPPYPATPEYIQKAKDVIKKMTAGGGTNIHGALKTSMLAAASSFANITTNTTTQKPEPIVIFLTDGDPTIGITDISEILNMVKELNEKQSAIFSLAFGDGADFSFLRQLSLANNGFARNIYEAADAALQLQNFYREVASPLLANVTFSYLPGQVVESSISQQSFHTLFLGSQLVVAGRLDKDTGSMVSGSVTGLTANGSSVFPSQSETIDDLSAELYNWEEREVEDNSGEKRRRKKKVPGTLERLWAYLTIQQLLDKRTVTDTEEVKKRALEMALRYNFVTPLTSLVVVKPNQSVEIDQESLRPQSLRNRLSAGNVFVQPRPSPTRTQYEGTSSFMEEPATNKLFTRERMQNLTLEDLSWLEGLVDRENSTVTLPLGVNGTSQQYRLGLHEEDWPQGECVSPRSKLSHCRHLPHCVLPDILSSATSYIRYYCPLPNGYAGICCPDSRYLSTTTARPETTTGDTVTTTTELMPDTTTLI